MGLIPISMRLRGTTPLFMHNIRSANPLEPGVQAMGELHKAKRTKKTDALKILREISDLEWDLGVYWVDGVGAALPGHVVRKSIICGARLSKLGRSIERAVVTVGANFAIDHDGPKDYETLKHDVRFRDQRMVRVGTSMVLRTRPRFNRWSCDVAVVTDDRLLTPKQVVECARDAGRFEGIGGARSLGFGRYDVEELK